MDSIMFLTVHISISWQSVDFLLFNLFTTSISSFSSDPLINIVSSTNNFLLSTLSLLPVFGISLARPGPTLTKYLLNSPATKKHC